MLLMVEERKVTFVMRFPPMENPTEITLISIVSLFLSEENLPTDKKWEDGISYLNLNVKFLSQNTFVLGNLRTRSFIIAA